MAFAIAFGITVGIYMGIWLTSIIGKTFKLITGI